MLYLKALVPNCGNDRYLFFPSLYLSFALLAVQLQPPGGISLDESYRLP